MTSTGTSLLEKWQKAFERLDDNPFIGPRPQHITDPPAALVGREADLRQINRVVLERQLVILDGGSGSGKTSLLQNGLFRRLDENGFDVVVARTWGRYEDGEDVGEYIARAIQRTHEPKHTREHQRTIDYPGKLPLADWVEDGGDRQPLGDWFQARAPGTAVLFLDQFEHLLRSPDPHAAEAVVRWVIAEAFAHDTRFVISLRTDAIHLLDPLLQGVKPFSMERVRVESLTDEEAIKQIMLSDKSGGKSGLTELAAGALLDQWREHRPTLLELQATLYTMYSRAIEPTSRGEGSAQHEDEATGPTLGVGAVTDLVAEADLHGLRNAFAFGHRQAIQLKIENAEQASFSVGLDPYLVYGTADLVRRTAKEFSSAGFKVPVADREFVRDALGRELGVLGPTLQRELELVDLPDPQQGAGDLDQAASLAEATAWKLFEVLGGREDPLAVSERDQVIDLIRKDDPCLAQAIDPPDSRRTDSSAGPMMGASAAATLLEEVRRAAFALEWLTTAEIAERDHDGTVQLTHDGSGKALLDWAERRGLGPITATHRLTASRGESHSWHDRSDPEHSLEGTPEDALVIANLCWRECRISMNARHVVFVNCDFSSSRFESCRFEGVTFVNCLLDDTNFENCLFEGSTPKELAKEPPGVDTGHRLAPSIEVPNAEEATFGLAPHQTHQPTDPSVLFSDTAGKPAMPGTAPSDISHKISLFRDFRPTTGGAAMIGGRVCFLTIYGCSGDFALHHVSGDGLDIVDHHGHIDIRTALVRGVSLSTDVSTEHRVALDVRDSVIVNTHFAFGLSGSATVARSQVVSLMNSSSDCTVALDNCRYQFVVNAEVLNGAEDSRDFGSDTRYFEQVPGTHSGFTLAPESWTGFGEMLRAMDYRFRPEDHEMRARERRLSEDASQASG